MGNCQSNCFSYCGNYCGQGGARPIFRAYYVPNSKRCSPQPCQPCNDYQMNNRQPYPQCGYPMMIQCPNVLFNNNNNNNNQAHMSHFSHNPNSWTFPQEFQLPPPPPLPPSAQNHPSIDYVPQLENLNLNSGEYAIFLRLLKNHNLIDNFDGNFYHHPINGLDHGFSHHLNLNEFVDIGHDALPNEYINGLASHDIERFVSNSNDPFLDNAQAAETMPFHEGLNFENNYSLDIGSIHDGTHSNACSIGQDFYSMHRGNSYLMYINEFDLK